MAVIARRYATALFEAAQEKGDLDGVSQAVKALHQSLEDEGVKAFLLDPRQSRDRKAEVLSKGFADAPAIFQNFLKIIAERRREFVLPDLDAEFDRLVLKSRGEAKGALEVAVMPSGDELERLRSKAQEFFGVRVDFDIDHKPELLGGFRLTVNNRRLDASVKTRLQDLKKELLSVSVR